MYSYFEFFIHFNVSQRKKGKAFNENWLSFESLIEIIKIKIRMIVFGVLFLYKKKLNNKFDILPLVTMKMKNIC